MKPKTMWYAEAEVLGYPLSVIAETESEAMQAILSEHRRWHRNAKSGVYAKNWEHLVEITEAATREMEIGKVWQP